MGTSIDTIYLVVTVSDMTRRRWHMTKNVTGDGIQIAKGATIKIGTHRHHVLVVEWEFNRTYVGTRDELTIHAICAMVGFAFEAPQLELMASEGWEVCEPVEECGLCGRRATS